MSSIPTRDMDSTAWMDIKRLLPQPFLQGPIAALELLGAQALLREVRSQDVLVHLGEYEPPALLVLTGLLVAQCTGAEAEKCAVALLIPHRIFLSGFSPRGSSPYEIKSIGRARVLVTPTNAVREYLAQAPVAALWAIHSLVRRQTDTHSYRAKLASLPLEARLAHFYWSISEPDTRHPGCRLEPKVPQHIVASYFGVAREEVSRKRQMLEKAGYLSMRDGRSVLNPDLLYLFSIQAASPLENPWLDELAGS